MVLYKQAATRRLAGLLKEHGLTIRMDDHPKVLNAEGRIVGCLAGTPKGGKYVQQTICRLVRDGVLPPEAKKTKIMK